jgi:hypothetical protein
MDDTEHKVAVIIRLREMLRRQREKFRSYLILLEQEHASIEGGNPEALLAQVELEQAIISEIFTLKKAIAPLEDLYQAAYPETESTVPALNACLEKMGDQIVARNARNRALLKEKMEDLRLEIASLRAWPRSRSPFAEVAPKLVDIVT